MENAEQRQRVRQIVKSALEKLPEKRGKYLDEVCGSDGALRAEVESLLPAYETSHRLSEPSEETEVVDGGQGLKSIGPYRLLRKLGEGGMGKVWLAEQTAPVRRQVALKLIKAGMYEENVLKRFQLERQSLAIMNHPSIAKVFDAGATPEGQPYFVMEYVPGASMGVMGNVYMELGLYSRAQSLLEQAQEIGRRALGPENPETIKSETSLAWVLTEEGRYTDAEKLQREALENCRRAFGPQHSDALAAMTTLGWILFLEGH